jgi:hypothetical protein
MGGHNRERITLGLFWGVIALAGLVSATASATDLIILREVPYHNAIEKSPEGPAVTVQTEQSELIQSLLNGPKLNDDDYGAVLASPPGGSLGGGVPTADVNALDGSRGDALSNVPNSGMGSFSSLNGIGGQISGQVNNAVQSGLQGLSSALGAANSGQ